MPAHFHWRRVPPLCLLLLFVLAGCVGPSPAKMELVAKWDRFEASFESAVAYAQTEQDTRLQVLFTSPLGDVRKVDGFWDGGATWRVRFMPDQAGKWSYRTICPDSANRGLHDRQGSFLCTAPRGRDRFQLHGPVRVSRDGRHFEHQDGTPFFWLADTAWSGPLLSSPEEWDFYVAQRAAQNFSAVQWVATQFRAAPNGDREGQLAYTGTARISLNPRFFQRLDQKMEALNRAGLLGVPVLIWDNGGRENPGASPGVALPEDQIILLARYMVARWGAHAAVWILNGDGDYRGPRAERWKRIGRAVFGDISHAPVTIHPGGMHWVWDEFKRESWVDICGYQSAHNASDANLKWIHSGPPATEWAKEPARPFLSLEAPYENHFGADRQPMNDFVVRRAHYWSLLNAPTCGVTYGGHGVWGWDDGTKPPIDHPNTGTPLAWPKALVMPGAGQMARLAELFSSIDFWRLRPAPEMLARQPGLATPRLHIAAARSPERDFALAYLPEGPAIELIVTEMPSRAVGTWFNPRDGTRTGATPTITGDRARFSAPGAGDWVLLLQSAARTR